MSDNQEQEYLEDGYVKISRRVFSSKTFSGLNAIQKYIAIYFILMANWKDNEWWDSYQKKFIKIKRGSFITSIEQIRKDIKDRLVTTKKIRTCVELLKNMQFLAIETTSHHSHITIVKYDLYQTDENYRANKRAKQGQSKGKARAITNNVKKVKNDKKKRERAPAVFLTEEEYQKLVTELGENTAKEYINQLSLYMKSRGLERKYKSHYATILAWHRKDEKEGEVKKLKESEFIQPKYKPKKVSQAEREKFINVAKEGLKKFKGAINSIPQSSGENREKRR